MVVVIHTVADRVTQLGVVMVVIHSVAERWQIIRLRDYISKIALPYQIKVEAQPSLDSTEADSAQFLLNFVQNKV